jgi:malonyl-CoA decarboxylase
MKASEWLQRSVALFRARVDAPEVPVAPLLPEAPEPGGRSTDDRLEAGLRRAGEALSPRELRQLLNDLQGVIDTRVSEVEGGRRAGRLMQWYREADEGARLDFWLLMSEQFVADPGQVRQAQDRFAAAVGTPEQAAAEVIFRRSTVSPRRRILQRFSAHPDGIRFLVDLRAQMQPQLKRDKRLLALDVEMEYMFSTWFDIGFLELRRISWDSPASLIEKLIRYEAVHDVRSWEDMKNRLAPDRRCYGFFHPRLPQEPLIFVEVALVNSMSESITPLLDELAEELDVSRASHAIFYSISNTQVGLRGVSFGDSLIKRVVESLRQEFPRLKTFATLSPIPGLRHWLSRYAPPQALQEWESVGSLPATAARARALLGWTARYLGGLSDAGQPLDPVARFHLGNGARVERLNWAGDPSPKGFRQSYGIMVNYLYDLRRLDRHRAELARGHVPVSPAVAGLIKAAPSEPKLSPTTKTKET